ncbi:hypothetical protein GCM10009765_32200 [Fodinicola feengrottensis]|uniref:Asp23/Gls24 family envelope stress response protein n=1 Tax=Fodinicola feengrottensis TaxID=435914 RepID=A0ABP4T160_9ACTN
MSQPLPSTTVHGVLADTVAAAVLLAPGVAGLRSGRFGEVATYLPGRRVLGVRLRPDGVAVDVAVLFGHSVFAVAEGVRAAVRDIVGDLPIDVTVDDVVLAP